MVKNIRMNTYKCSDGTRISKAQIDRNVRRAKEEVLQDQLNDRGYVYCVDCDRHGYPDEVDDMEFRLIDCSHTKSVDWCQKNGCTELAWDKSNIKPRCRFHHNQLDKTSLNFKKQIV